VAVAAVGAVLLRETTVTQLGAAKTTPVSQSIDVLITAQEIQEGLELKPVLFRKESRPSRDFAAGRVVSDFDQLRGVYAKSFIPAGQPLLSELLTTKAPINSVVPKIRPGFRAITLKLDKQTTNEGWARAGVRVDVLLVSSQDGRSSAAIIAQNLRVLSSGTSVSPEFGGESKIIQNGESTVTLEVSSEDQKRLTLAAGRGELRLLLRGDEDSAIIEERMNISLDSVIGLPGEKTAAAPSDQGWVMIDGRKYKVVGARLVPG
jgi:Flp pilus assembly protein CpaB